MTKPHKKREQTFRPLPFDYDKNCLLLGSLNRLQILLQSYDQIVVLPHTGTAGNQVAANHVLLQVLQRIDLALDRSFVQHFGRLLEGSGRNEARSLQCGTGDTLQNLRGSRRNDITHLDEIQVTTLEARILVAQLAQRNDLSGLQHPAVRP